MRVGSVFSGIGGFDLGFQRLGFKIAWQCEIDLNCKRLLWSKFKRPCYHDIREMIHAERKIRPVEIICGGDPCQSHSRARAIQANPSQPDMSGYFLALVQKLSPKWIVRENVLAPTVAHFSCALEAIGYRTVTIRLEAHRLTGQARTRYFIVGNNKAPRWQLTELFEQAGGSRDLKKIVQTEKTICCLTARHARRETGDTYIWDSGKLRILAMEERERFAGYPVGWTEGFSEGVRAKMLGNSVIPACASWIAKAIRSFDSHD